MIPTFLLSGLMSDNENGTWTRVASVLPLSQRKHGVGYVTCVV